VRIFPSLLLPLFLAASAHAWGPHSRITAEALNSLHNKHPLRGQLGTEFDQLTNYCWIPDFKGLPFQVARADFYSDDFLLMPVMIRHLDHICPEVEQSYEPYFRRALQALRGESPENAARWIGSLLHFIQDSGSPPHAARIRGDVHIRMENWLAPSNIVISPYAPRLLATNDDAAVKELASRMKELIEFAKVLGQKLRTPVLLGNRRAVTPLASQCANECARVSADVLHTLSWLTTNHQASGFELRGRIVSNPAPTDARFAARLMIAGTNISTVANETGEFVLNGIPRGTNALTIVHTGHDVFHTNVFVTAHLTKLVFTLRANSNLVRNARFTSQWIGTNALDCWTKSKFGWEGEVVSLQQGRRYVVRAEFLPNSACDLTAHWSGPQPFVIPRPLKMPRIETRQLTRKQPEFVIRGSTNAALMQLSIHTSRHPTNELRAVSIIAIPD
jgi:hypothetical protein